MSSMKDGGPSFPSQPLRKIDGAQLCSQKGLSHEQQ